ncbi:MAG: chromate resistance protein [Deltaproteobacteria bacterium]|nr:chromate resistance protein [Deltaproteobacteria bacterium]
MTSPTTTRWLLLIHQIPRSPAYLRAKVGKQLARVGAVAVKNSVYVLPRSNGTLEDFQWIARELHSAGAEVTVFEAAVVDGLTDAEIEERFRVAITPEFDALRDEAAAGVKALKRKRRGAEPTVDVPRLRKRLDELTAIDFFAAPAAKEAAARVAECERLAAPDSPIGLPAVDRATLVGRTWATRKGIHVDRIATAWLIRRFLDADARFLWLGKDEAAAAPDVLRFDTFGGEFTHEGDRCSFELLAARAGLDTDVGVRAVGEIIHDLDLKDAKFNRPETAGVGALLNGVCWSHPDDDDRLRAGCALLDALHESLTRQTRRMTAE